MNLTTFVSEYFISPIRVEQGYNYVNTIVYALIAFALLFVFSKFFKKTGTKINARLFLSLLPFVVFGSLARSLVDSGQLARMFWTVSPGIYLGTAFLFFVSFILSIWLEKVTKIVAWKTAAGLGVLFLIGLIIFSMPSEFSNLGYATVILTIFVLVATTSYFILKKSNWLWAIKPLSFIAIAAQMFDATITSFLVQFFGAVEKHPLPQAAIDLFGSGFVFLPMKIIVVLIAIFVISKDVKDAYFRNTLILAIATLGLAQGLRNILSFVL